MPNPSCGNCDTSTYIHSVRHDGHLFVVYSDKAIIHHPSCPCRGRP